MSGPLLRSGECRKFAPNIFNKTKCTNCFRQKEEHSAEALESNRATRKIAKCGYLFVAPGWDFTNPLNRTKRWQRRWFVLYDDGELSYALDEHPETVPQASIDMNKVLEVADAEDVTGNAYSLAITAPDNVHFVKGTCREEARWWNEVLSVFPRSKGRPKRNATFPGSQTSSSTPAILQTPPVRDVSSSVSSDYGGRRVQGSLWEEEDVFPTRDLPPTPSTPIETPVQPSVDTRKEHPEVSRRLLLEEFESECKLKDIADSLTRPRHRRLTSPAVTPPPPSSHEPTRDSDTTTPKQVRGDPDGCGLDLTSLRYSPSSELRVELPAEDLLNIKKGWLMKQGNDKEWNKHWFVLRGAALLYYRDPSAEDQGILDGVIDLSGVSAVTDVQVARNYGFQTTTWDERSYVLSAVTAGIRANWMQAIRRAAGLDSKIEPTPLQLERDREMVAPPTPLTGRSIIFSSDDEYRTASEGRRESGEWGDTLPPSPPLNRTPISKVKERARGGLRSRTYSSKRSRSSPPSSRRSTLDSVPQEDFVLACCGQMQESEADVTDSVSVNVGAGEGKLLLDKVQSQSCELQEVKRQLTAVLRQLSSAEEELLRLRQRKVDVSALEKQVEDLIQRVEDANKQRARDAAELDSLKKRYVDDKAHWDRDLTDAQCELQLANQRYSQLCVELADSAKLVQRLREELSSTDDLTRQLRDELGSVTNRLAAGIEENDQLYRRLRELDGRPGGPTHSTSRSRSVDSLSDLTNIQLDGDLCDLDKERVIEEYSDLRARFEKAVSEIRLMKRELRESQAQSDVLELSLINARQDLKARQTQADAQTNLMAARIEDLVMKLCSAEKQIRTLKQKLSKSETREKRRSLSLKGRESFTICKELEDKLAELEIKVSALTLEGTSSSKSPSPVKSLPPPSPSHDNSRAAARLRRKSLDSATCSEPMKVLIRLSNLESKVAKAAREIVICPSSPSPLPSSESITSLDETEQKSQLPHEAMNGTEPCDEVDGKEQHVQLHISSEIKKMETLLRNKLKGLSKKRDSLIVSGQWTNEAKVSLLAEKLAFESVLVGRLHDAVAGSVKGDIANVERFMMELDVKLSGGKPNIETSLDYLSKALTRHLLNQKIENTKPRKQKEKKKASESLAVIEINKKKKNLDQKVSVFVDQVVDQLAAAFAVENLGDQSCEGESKIKAAWSLAQEAVNEELIQTEITQVMNQCSRTYQNIVEEEKESRFLPLVQDRTTLEQWSQTTKEHLQRELEVAVSRLFDKYRENVYRLKSQNTSPVKTAQEDEEKSRSLLQRFIDIIAHKALLDSRVSLLQEMDVDPLEIVAPSDVAFDENTVLAEVQNLYLKYVEELKVEQNNESTNEEKLKEHVQLLAREMALLRDCLVEAELKRRGTTEKLQLDTLEPLTATSTNLCDQCCQLRDQVYQLRQLVLSGQECQRCEYLQQQIKRREIQFEEDIRELRMHQEEEIAQLKAELEQERINLMQRHEAEQAMLKERARKLERRLGTLDSEYSQQMENLRAAYHKTLSSTLDRDLQGEENIRQRYQAEIEHLRALCEKGLIGMENSHRRMIAELEEKHRQEAEQLRREKEIALAEETQATLAALDAMRKAHEAEVQREVAKFKQEFLNNMRASQDIGALHREHEQEMEEIKQEILSLSEKYSVKCVESSRLEEQLRAANEQLAQAQQHIMQLDSRNKQLRAHLVSEASDCSAEFMKFEDKEKSLTPCWRGGRPDTIAAALALLHRRQCQPHPDQQCSSESSVNEPTNQDPSPLLRAETKRNPMTCGQNFPSPPLCSIKGMVAERKKLFEQTRIMQKNNSC
ncbi:protein outspread isoform X2 [Macrosteles quadrilineatus]|uniref:protein outspread isoform X2 n=1 Tax=Macrosteles quadrilineatus TaxID=74068 RepID=UPI0023E24AC9|nr:protein outspread isoform X2 [Macrosteles quadrilineatus]